MFGCSSWAVISASWTKSRCARALPARSAASVFIATRRRRLGSYIRRTVAVPPAPISPSSIQRHGNPTALASTRRRLRRRCGAARSARVLLGQRDDGAEQHDADRRADQEVARPSSGGGRAIATDRVGGGSSVPPALREAAPPARASAPAPTPASRDPASDPSDRAAAGPAPASARASAPARRCAARRRDRQACPGWSCAPPARRPRRCPATGVSRSSAQARGSMKSPSDGGGGNVP